MGARVQNWTGITLEKLLKPGNGILILAGLE